MKTKMFWLVIAVAAVLTGLTSCQKEEPETIINSEVLEVGFGEGVTEKPANNPDGTKGTTLSYESWIMLKVETRASSDRKVSVTLNNTISVVVNQILVKNFNFGEAKATTSYKVGESRKEGYVTIVDSVLVYNVAHDNFSFDYELVYQVPIYDDGVTKKTMPYYRYGKIINEGYILEDMPDIEIDKVIYQRKLFKHRINAEFNNKMYLISTDILLKKIIGGEADILLSATVVDKRVELIGDDVYSWVKIRKERQLSGIEEFSVEAILKHSTQVFQKDTVFHVMKNDEIIPVSQITKAEEKVISHDENLSIIEVSQAYIGGWNTKSGDANNTNMRFDMYHQKALYKDADIEVELPYYGYGEIKGLGHSFSNPTYWQRKDMGSVGLGVADLYLTDYVHKASCTFNGKTIEASLEESIVLLEWVK